MSEDSQFNQTKKSGFRRRRRRRRSNVNHTGAGNGGSPVSAETAEISSEPIEAQGVLEILPEGYGFLRTQQANYLPRPEDVWVAPDVIRDRRLEEGVEVDGKARPTGRRGPALYEIEKINGLPAEQWDNRRHFQDLTATSPEEPVRLETGREPIEPRVVDLVAPIGKGQRCLVVAPPKAGKTTLLQQVAHAVGENHPEIHLLVLLIDERPEEVTDWRRRVPHGEVIASSSDELARNHVSVAEIVLERSKRLVESGRDVLVLLDSLTRLARAYNVEQRGSGKILSGGIDSRTLENPRRFFGAARRCEEGGSLTIIASCLIDTGSKMDEVIFQEFKGTGNTEIVLDRKLFEKRVFPCIDIHQTGTRKEEKLLREWTPKVHLLRRALSTMAPVDAIEALLKKLGSFDTNEKFLASLGASQRA
ncbi:MAG: transcription termination factor Rho [Acidobacteriota bacterium]|nr:MAG: transcription termination factor Rho [Acidobacteriota bacterium]